MNNFGCPILAFGNFARSLMQERPLPRIRIRDAIGLVLVLLVFASVALGLWIYSGNLLWPVTLFVACAVFHVIHSVRRRCPECCRRLAARREPVSGSRRSRLFLDCPHCKIAWEVYGDRGACGIGSEDDSVDD
jgi:hypothetical protein